MQHVYPGSKHEKGKRQEEILSQNICPDLPVESVFLSFSLLHHNQVLTVMDLIFFLYHSLTKKLLTPSLPTPTIILLRDIVQLKVSHKKGETI
ncbi:hypothetical protein VIGAN_02073400 [Vigna angularis var. angularis]|uniref:Uncharacterized protein n=1 Tax=Vigna angularis var. angularis TaxID=157739 RepID=A0A0S3RC65_PHAAN|nr:hypothetical protein VIGAN_02073400 [Vigna angularis var. angularis]